MLLATFKSLRRTTLLKQGVSKALEVNTHFLGTLSVNLWSIRLNTRHFSEACRLRPEI